MNMDESLFIEMVRQGDAVAMSTWLKNTRRGWSPSLATSWAVSMTRATSPRRFSSSFRKNKRFRSRSELQAWLFAIAYNRA